MHVLLATDGSPSSIAAAQRAGELLKPADRVTLLHVVSEAPQTVTTGLETTGLSGSVPLPGNIEPLWEHEMAEAAAEIDRTAARLTSTNLHKRIEIGDVGGTVCRVAEELKVDVIVVGSHGRGAIERLLLGSATSQIVRHAPCAVLVVRPEPKK
jgi:nucleotide-binding universal stress UspA family protein